MRCMMKHEMKGILGIRLWAFALGALLNLFPAAPLRAGGLPEGVTALPKAMASRLGELLKEAEKYRGLTAREPVPSGIVDAAVLKQKVLASFREDLPPETLRPAETSLKAFGFIPESLDLVTFFPDLLTSQVAGFYDPERHYLALVQREGQALAEDSSANPANPAQRMDEAVLVHELTHALQDQYFHLETFTSGVPLDDGDLAKVAVEEGDATLIMMDFFVQGSVENLPGLEESMADLFGDPRQMMESASGMPGTAELAAAPAWFQDTLLFSYFQGFQFCLSARRTGGQALLDKAFSTDPPRSTEQILHPEKWHTKRDDPVVISWPDLAPALPGWTRASEGQLGELSIRTLLRGALHDEKKIMEAAAGWGGDRFAVYQKDSRRLLVWITEWDTGGDARQFQAAARALGRDWSVTRADRRVVVTRGGLPKAALRAMLRP
jgi:hypothetical protein